MTVKQAIEELEDRGVPEVIELIRQMDRELREKDSEAFNKAVDNLSEHEDAADAHEVAMNAIHNACQPVNMRWIPVTEKRPESRTKVLVFADGIISACWVVGKQFRFADNSHAYGVTHWQPLPKEPKL